MERFSFCPQYHFATIMVMHSYRDSMREWEAPKFEMRRHKFHEIGAIPIFGIAVGAVRGVAAVADIIMGLSLSIFGDAFGMQQVSLGLENLVRAFIEVSPVLTIPLALQSHNSLFFLAAILGPGLLLTGIDYTFFSFKAPSNAPPIALYHDNTCIKEIRNLAHSYNADYDGWLGQIEQYGTPVNLRHRF